MKTLKRSLALWLAVVLTAGLLYVPAFGSDTKADQQEPALTTTEEAAQDEGAVEEAEDITVIEEEAEEPSEDEQEEPAAITEDEDEKDDSAGIDDGAAAITEEADESSEDIEEESEEILPQAKDEDESAEIPEGTAAEETILPEANDVEGLPVVNSVEDTGIADAIDLSLEEMKSGTITGEKPKHYYRFVPEVSGTYKFFTESKYDLVGTLYESSLDNQIEYDDDSGSGNNFKITCKLQAGTEYYLEVRTYSDPELSEYPYSVGVEIPTMVKVFLNANGGVFDTGEVTYTEEVEKGSYIYDYFGTEPYFADKSKGFTGWSLTKNGSVIDDVPVEKDITLYATWKPYYTVTYHDARGKILEEYWEDPGSGEVRNKNTYTRRYLADYSISKWSNDHILNQSEKDIVFAGWSKTNGGEPIEDDIKLSGNLELFAVWKAPVTVTLDANGGSMEGYYDDQGNWFDEPTNTVRFSFIPGEAFFRSYNYSYDRISNGDLYFLGWGTSKSGGLIGNDGLVINSNTTLYAQWGKPCTITFNANGGYYWDYEHGIEVETETREYGVGAIIDRHETYVYGGKEGYTLAGWSRTKDGAPIGHDGYQIKGGETFYAVWVKPGWNKVGSGWMYLMTDKYDDHYLCENEWLLDGGKWYYFDRDNWMVTGWRKVGGEWYYLKSNGAMAANDWAKDSKGWCWMDASGKITKNKWIKDKNEWYFLKANGYMAANEWAKDSGGWYWMDGSGKITKNKWIKSGGYWYYLKANGYMAANEWAKDGTGWCWMDGNGRITKNKWILSGGQWYYLKANGYMAANEWARDNKGWCWMDGSGKITKSKWITTGGKKYYLDANGYRVTGTQKIGGKTYKFNSSGVLIK